GSVAEAIQTAGVSGGNRWEAVELVNWNGEVYLHTVFPDPAVRAIYSRMDVEFVTPPACPHCQAATLKRLRGVVVDEATWSGQDLFYLMSPGLLLATERLKKVIDQNAFTGLEFVPAEEFVPS